MKKHAVALLSGGLDSTLAARLILDQGLKVDGLFFSLAWGCCDKLQALKAAHTLGIPLMVMKLKEDYIDVLRTPRFGRGSGMNPCVDCRIHMFAKAKDYMESIGASFLVTGEVLGQRPMSQLRHSLETIESESGLEDLLLRPLSAKRLPPTRPEREGLVDRERLLEVSGRSRQEQLALARQFGITEYAQPAGGCSLTEPDFAERTRDLFRHHPRPMTHDMELLALGRHFRLDEATKLIVGRNAEENLRLTQYEEDGYRLVTPNFPGPSVMIAGQLSSQAIEAAESLILRYTKRERIGDHPLEFRLNGTRWTLEATAWERPQELSLTPIGAGGGRS